MKAWQLLVGTLVLGGIAGVAIAAGRGKATHCVTVTADADAVARINAAVPGLKAKASVDLPAVEMMRSIVRAGWPWCDWSDDAATVIVGADGNPVAWSAIVATLGSHTMADIANDPALQMAIVAVFQPTAGKVAAAPGVPSPMDVVTALSATSGGLV